MGFYGNITNTSRTQFQFDKIYSNRHEMDLNKNVDGIYFGRYVLVEYGDKKPNLNNYLPIYLKPITGEIGLFHGYTSPNLEEKTLIKIGDIYEYTQTDTNASGAVKYPGTIGKGTICIQQDTNKFYIVINEKELGKETVAIFQYASEVSDSPYTINYNIDTAKYGPGRGYDSTVWQKVYTDNLEKYVMIAELNSVVPTFDISADAPTLIPITPHFDINSTNVYYKLHAQPTWGFRIKANQSKQVKNDDYNTSTDLNIYPSDESIEWVREVYDPISGESSPEYWNYNQGQWDAEKSEDNENDYIIPAAIYYNKAGFESLIRTYSEEVNNEMLIEPTGQSGNLYNNHKGNASTSVQPDIQELKIMLPAIGNMISDAWDMIYGKPEEKDFRPIYKEIVNDDNTITYEVETDENGNEKKAYLRWQDIDWKDPVTGQENLAKGGMTRNINSFAGCINTIHDLIGMIVTTTKPDNLNEEEYNKKYIYRSENLETGAVVFERILKSPTYSQVDLETFISNYEDYKNKTYPSTQEKNIAYENLFKLFDAENYYILNDEGEYLYINIKALPSYLEKNNNLMIFTDDGFEYSYIAIQGLEEQLVTILGALVECRNLLGTDTPATTDKSTVQGALNALNAIIDRFKDAVPGQFTFVDEDGKLISMNWTTKQPFRYVNYGSKNKQKFAGEDIENRFIDLTFDFDRGSIELTHKFNEVDNTKTESDKNVEEGTGINSGIGNTLKLYTPIVDNVGHIVGYNEEEVTLPFGYKTIKVENNEEVLAPSTESVKEGQSADNTQDVLNLNASNRWIKFDNSNEDIIKLGHRLTSLGSGEPNKKYGLENNISIEDLDADNTFEVPVFRFDEAGHIDFAETHTVSLPENFDKIEVIVSPENFQNEKLIEGTAASIVADSMTDTLTFKQGNKWAIITGDASNDNITFSHYVNKFSETEKSTDFNNVNNGKTFYTQEIDWDEAGHLISSNKHNFILPDNFKTINIVNNGSDKTTIDASIVNGTLIADTLVDTAIIDTGNRWIQLEADPDNNKVTIYHAKAGDAPSENTTFDKAETPKYGASFKIPEITFDQAGHISTIGTHTVTFQTPVLNPHEETSSAVLINLEMNAEDLEFTQTYKNVGDLTLTGYIATTGDNAIEAADSINDAFNKVSTHIENHKDKLDALIEKDNQLQQTIETETNNRTTAINDLTSTINSNNTALNTRLEVLENADLITRVTTLEEENADLKDRVTALEDENTGLKDRVAELETAIAAIQTAIEQYHPAEEENPEEPTT